MASLISTSTLSPFDPAYSYYNYPLVPLQESAQAAVEAQTSSSTPFVPIDEVQASAQPETNLVETSNLPVEDPLLNFDGFQLQEPNENEGFRSKQQESRIIRDVSPNVVLQSFSLSQHIKLNWEKFQQDNKISI
jgi:hypothetical protein